MRAGTLQLANTTFTNNTATAGAGGLPFGAAAAGAAGTSAGGAMFVNAGATATAVVTPVFAGNAAAVDNDVAGLLALAPVVAAAIAAIPTLGEWALLALVLLVATLGMRARRDG